MQAHSFATGANPIPAAIQAMMTALEKGVGQIENAKYPPCNIFRTGDDAFVIETAVAGFAPEQLDVSVEKNILTISGTKPEVDDENRTYLQRGLGQRSFKQTYRLGEYVVVDSADILNGILTVSLSRKVPDEAKPRKVDIRTE